MRYGRVLDFFFLVRMTRQAQFAVSWKHQVVLVVAAVRIVTGHAGLLHGRMNEFCLLDFLLLVRMTRKADVVPFRNEELPMVALMR